MPQASPPDDGLRVARSTTAAYPSPSRSQSASRPPTTVTAALGGRHARRRVRIGARVGVESHVVVEVVGPRTTQDEALGRQPGPTRSSAAVTAPVAGARASADAQGCAVAAGLDVEALRAAVVRRPAYTGRSTRIWRFMDLILTDTDRHVVPGDPRWRGPSIPARRRQLATTAYAARSASMLASPSRAAGSRRPRARSRG